MFHPNPDECGSSSNINDDGRHRPAAAPININDTSHDTARIAASTTANRGSAGIAATTMAEDNGGLHYVLATNDTSFGGNHSKPQDVLEAKSRRIEHGNSGRRQNEKMSPDNNAQQQEPPNASRIRYAMDTDAAPTSSSQMGTTMTTIAEMKAPLHVGASSGSTATSGTISADTTSAGATPVSADGDDIDDSGRDGLMLDVDRYTMTRHWISFEQLAMLYAGLCLTTVMALLSAMDAKRQCLSHEMYFLLELATDDDSVEVSERAIIRGQYQCVALFRRVVAPAGAISFLLSAVAIMIISRHLQKTTTTKSASESASTQSLSLPTQTNALGGGTAIPAGAALPINEDQQDNHQQQQQQHVSDGDHYWSQIYTLVVLTVIQVLIVACWVYWNVIILLRPKQDADEDGQNPYNSLAAVDYMGNVGDNANLYYLSWISMGLSLMLLYSILADGFRSVRDRPRRRAAGGPAVVRMAPQLRRQRQQSKHATPMGAPHNFMDAQSTTLSVDPSLQAIHGQSIAAQRKKKWYQTMLRLRLRAGYWTAIWISSLVTFLSAAFIFDNLFRPFSILSDDDVVAGGDAGNDNNNYGDDDAYDQNADAAGGGTTGSWDFRGVQDYLIFEEVCNNLSDEVSFSTVFCHRTHMAVVTGAIAPFASIVAIILHSFERRQYLQQHGNGDGTGAEALAKARRRAGMATKLLWCEFLLSACLSAAVGFNALYSSGVGGPAAKVGNLYYSSWLCFMLCLRVCLGCLEEIYAVEMYSQPRSKPMADVRIDDQVSHMTNPKTDDTSTIQPVQEQQQQRCQDGASHTSLSNSQSSDGLFAASGPSADNNRSERVPRLRRYFALSILSMICAASTGDAALYRESAEELTWHHRYVMVAPGVVSAIATLQFLLCLKRASYFIVAKFWVGGVLSILCFHLWMADLVLTMHSEDSWAVNGIGEIKAANLYYFTWASIVTAGLQMMSYLKPYLSHDAEDIMVWAWGVMAKVSFVVFGAATHVWYNISASCHDETIEGTSIPFCRRTMFALVVGFTGTGVGSIMLAIRVFNLIAAESPTYHRIQGIFTLLLLVMFILAVALVTGIGGPGQSVGDLYYSTWLGFCVALGISAKCYEAFVQSEQKLHRDEQQQQKGNGEKNMDWSQDRHHHIGDVEYREFYDA